MRSRSLFLYAAPLLLILGCGDEQADTDPTIHTAQYVRMSDGTDIAVDVFVPERSKGQRVPTIMSLTRYWRAFDFTKPIPNEAEAPGIKPYLDAGYALVTVDVRGTGASFGVSDGPWSAKEVGDYAQLVDWVVQQPWSNGRAGAMGDSYLGSTAALLSAVDHPAVKAVVPRFFEFDPYLSASRPGGILAEAFIHPWSNTTRALDLGDICGLAGQNGTSCEELKAQVRGPKPVDADKDRSLLTQAQAQHQQNVDIYLNVKALEYRDSQAPSPQWSVTPLYERIQQIERGGAAWMNWESWMDAGTVDSSLSAFMSMSNPQQVMIGAWNHGATADADPFLPEQVPVSPSEEEQMAMIIAFFDEHLKTDTPPPPKREIRYYVMGEGVWRTAQMWPPPEVQEQTWYLDAQGLTRTMPQAESGQDTYAVDFTATTGVNNRWYTHGTAGDVFYGDRSTEDARLLTYTSPVLAEDTRIAGHAQVTLYLSTTHNDGAVYVYLEDISPDGEVTYLTEGQLRLLHRKVSQAAPPYHVFGPYHSYTKADALPVTPGELMEVKLTLLPTAALIKAGHRLRLAIAGHDADTFERLPAEGNPVFTLRRSVKSASHVTLPVLP
jgi:putative CocE/NonD family hydrolase